MKRILSFIMSIVMLLTAGVLVGCNKDGEDGATLSFSAANSIEEMKKLDGKTVSIMGYMSTLSPISGAFMYLLNLPYQSCPFCEPNSTTLSNTMAIYAPKGKKFEFTDRLIKVTGKLEFGDFEDEYGYNYTYRIVDASYVVVNTSEMGEHLQLWQQLASTEVIAVVYRMYDYINFLCFWGTYTYPFDSGTDYLHPTDVMYFLEGENSQFHYGYAEGYFDGMISTVESVDKEAFSKLVENIKKAKQLSDEALAAFNEGDYVMLSEYTKNGNGGLVFGDGRNQYKMNKADEYEQRMTELYREFAVWLGEWEV